MLVAERQRSIVAVVLEDGSARVGELAHKFQVTEETIRRDLERLEAEGKLLRSHGGAVAPSNTPRERNYTERQLANAREKNAIARRAVGMIQEGDTILVDASSTGLQVARLLGDLDVTVLTNSILVSLSLADRPRLHVVCIGGSLSSPSLSFAGQQSEEALNGYHVNKVFLSCTGADIEFGLSDINERQAMLKAKMMEVADRTILMVDHSKFGLKSLRRFARLDEIDEIVTDAGADPMILDAFRELCPNITVAPF